MEDDELLVNKPEVFLYHIPSKIQRKQGYLHRASDWNISEPDWYGKVLVYKAGPSCHIQLEDKKGDVHGQAVLKDYPDDTLGPVLDSSRYFTLRMQKIDGSFELVGIGFTDRNDSSEFSSALTSYFAGLTKKRKPQELEEEPASKLAKAAEYSNTIASIASLYTSFESAQFPDKPIAQVKPVATVHAQVNTASSSENRTQLNQLPNFNSACGSSEIQPTSLSHPSKPEIKTSKPKAPPPPIISVTAISVNSEPPAHKPVAVETVKSVPKTETKSEPEPAEKSTSALITAASTSAEVILAPEGQAVPSAKANTTTVLETKVTSTTESGNSEKSVSVLVTKPSAASASADSAKRTSTLEKEVASTFKAATVLQTKVATATKSAPASTEAATQPCTTHPKLRSGAASNLKSILKKPIVAKSLTISPAPIVGKPIIVSAAPSVDKPLTDSAKPVTKPPTRPLVSYSEGLDALVAYTDEAPSPPTGDSPEQPRPARSTTLPRSATTMKSKEEPTPTEEPKPTEELIITEKKEGIKSVANGNKEIKESPPKLVPNPCFNKKSLKDSLKTKTFPVGKPAVATANDKETASPEVLVCTSKKNISVSEVSSDKEGQDHSVKSSLKEAVTRLTPNAPAVEKSSSAPELGIAISEEVANVGECKDEEIAVDPEPVTAGVQGMEIENSKDFLKTEEEVGFIQIRKNLDLLEDGQHMEQEESEIVESTQEHLKTGESIVQEEASKLVNNDEKQESQVKEEEVDPLVINKSKERLQDEESNVQQDTLRVLKTEEIEDILKIVPNTEEEDNELQDSQKLEETPKPEGEIKTEGEQEEGTDGEDDEADDDPNTSVDSESNLSQFHAQALALGYKYMSGNDFKCHKCQETFTDVRRIKTHWKNVHHFKSPGQCVICKLPFPTRVEVTQHRKTAHGSKCEVCGKQFKKPLGLKDHMRTVHKKTLEFPCTQCSSTFPLKVQLMKHIESHENETGAVILHQCSECHNKFLTAEDLVGHSLTHVKNYVCDECGQRFKSKGPLKQHYKSVHPGCHMPTNEELQEKTNSK